ncbi:MAG: hypothetical protein IKA76_01905 [Clostridia bacterium]|nr:hypothetical protein [Clostridia bacterium]
MNRNDKRVKWACYTSNISMAVVGNLSPLLFLTFRNLYGISYSLLGLLVLINFVTQLTVDLIFSFFSHKFNIPLAVKLTPYLTIGGLVLYALAPILFPTQVYVGLVIGTVIFSAASGFCEVLISPVIAALPSDNPERDMSKLHSIYAWGVVGDILFATLFLLIFGARFWQILALCFLLIPLSSAILFGGAKLPKMDTPEKASGVLALLKKPALWLCVFAIFLGGASECTMAQWCSGYLEEAMGIPKVWGDVFGVALFGFMLGLGRTMYAKKGKQIERVLFLSAIGATVCYGTAALSGIPILGLIACGMTGLFTAMLWPGSLIVAADRVPTGGVFIYAMMAAGGDLGASVGPQLVGVITDGVAANPAAWELAAKLGLSGEQLGMKCGVLVGMLFPLIAILVYLYIWRSKKRRERLASNL